MAKDPTLLSCLVAEFVGTFFLIFTVGMNVELKDIVWGGISIGSVLMVCIYALGGISGGHFNPAVTFAVSIVERLGGPVKGFLFQKLFLYWAAQLAGGIAGGFCYRSVFDKGISLSLNVAAFGVADVGILEIIYTFMLCFVVLNVAVAQENQPNQYFGIAIGGVIFAGAYGAGAVCGGCFNPAVALGLDISHFSHFNPKWSPLYALCQLIGGALAAGVFRFVRSSNFTDAKEEPTESVMFLSEFLGTYMLVLTVGLNVLAKSPAAGYSIASSLMSMIYALSSVSGAHFNPAVTLAVLLSGRAPDMTLKRAAGYVGAQLTAGKLASMTYSFVYSGQSFPLGPGEGYGMEALGIVEVAFTLLLSYVVLAVAVSTTTNSSNNFGFAIGACVTVAGNAGGPISGGAFNPAVAFGIGTSTGPFEKSIVMVLQYCGFQLVGGVLAAIFFGVTHAADVDHEEYESQEEGDEEKVKE
mmetsp:Transcript_7750/g.21671  ORF Transcript_7750/g.21671 Transcript_7750/m.21671 type:complete len:469 (-) Transcript_7750:268-1674(-)